ncbi:MAG TPA: EutN/CcmL family microcompartment protein [Opitutaceae bacterium]|nr:EutN/CcmL family microcompartment protein [Opitutaceae bacterium]
MILARIDGTIVSAACHPSMEGWRTVICQPLDAEGCEEGTPLLAIDPLGAALHQRVILSTDGATTRQTVGDPHTPLRNIIIGIADPAGSETRNSKPETRN